MKVDLVQDGYIGTRLFSPANLMSYVFSHVVSPPLKQMRLSADITHKRKSWVI